jgi:hypothetical protein
MKRDGKGTHTSWRKERGPQSEEDKERSKGYMHKLEVEEANQRRTKREGKGTCTSWRKERGQSEEDK